MEYGEQRRAKIADCLRRRKVRLKKIRLCQDCGNRPPKRGKTLCIDCLASRRDREAAKRAQKKLLDERGKTM
jgi:hypothetical protein